LSKDRFHKPVILAALVLTLVYLFYPLVVSRSSVGMDVHAVGNLPVLYSGRFKPIDSVARNSLMMIGNRQTFKRDGEAIDAATWLLDVMARPDLAASYEVFRVDHPGVRELMGLNDPSRKRFAYNTLMQRAGELQAQAILADQTPRAQRDLMQNKVLQLSNKLALYQSFASMHALNIIPGDSGSQDWRPLHTVSQMNPTPQQARIVESYRALLGAYRDRDVVVFNQNTSLLRTALVIDHRSLIDKAALEATFNRYGLFHRASLLYLVIGLMVFVSWLKWQSPLARAAFLMLLLTWLVHSTGLVLRVHISGRPPVTNLYSSALFIGWGIVLLCLVLEYFYRNTMGLITAAVAGFLTLLIAQGLSGNGDTMAVLQAVLDTNFWLATHVVVITLGYWASFM